jgi:uncharacterized protein
MKIKIDDIPEGGLQISATAASAPWLRDIVFDVFGPDHVKDNDMARADLQLFKKNRDITVLGGVILKYHPTCDRCLRPFQKQEQVTIHQILVPSRAHKAPAKGSETEVPDEDFGYYKDEEINLSDVIKESIILSQSMVNKCNQECRGLCSKCGKNLNDGPCKCKKEELGSSPFAGLKKAISQKD